MKVRFLVLIGLLGLSTGFNACGSESEEENCRPTNPQASTICENNAEYWVDNCGERAQKKADCLCGCANASVCKSNCDCSPTNQQASVACHDDAEWWIDDCGNQSEKKKTCQCGCANQLMCIADCYCEPTNPEDSVVCHDGAEWWVDDCGFEGEQKAQCECGCADELSCETECCSCNQHDYCDMGCNCDPDCMQTIVCPEMLVVDDGLDPEMDLYAVAAIDDENIWAVGNAEKMVHFDGDIWSLTNSPAANFDYSLDSIDCGVSTCWAVGGHDTGFGVYATYLLFDGQNWSADQTSMAWRLNDVALVGDDDGWAVGNKYSFCEIDNGSFNPGFSPMSPSKTMYGVALAENGRGWAVGQGGQVWRLDTEWEDYGSKPTSRTLYAVALEDYQNGWAVGDGGVMVRLEAGAWSVAQSVTHRSLRDVVIRTDGTGWAAGSCGALLYYDGNAWGQCTYDQDCTQPDLSGLTVTAAGIVWIVGEDGYRASVDTTK